MAGPVAKRASSNGSPHSTPSLGYIGQESSDPLTDRVKQVRPNQKPPSFVGCAARKQAGSGLRLGLPRCKNLFCPHCHSERQKDLRTRLLSLVRLAKEGGAGLRFLTLTAAHNAPQPLAQSAAAVEGGWKRARAGALWKRLRKKHGLLGVVSVVDVTYGAHGWHFHIHAIVVAHDAKDAATCGMELAEQYKRELVSAGFDVTDDTTDERKVYDEDRLVGYISKSWHKKPKDGSETPMQLLERGTKGSDEALVLFLEAHDVFQHKHRGVVSHHLTRALKRRAIDRKG